MARKVFILVFFCGVPPDPSKPGKSFYFQAFILQCKLCTVECLDMYKMSAGGRCGKEVHGECNEETVQSVAAVVEIFRVPVEVERE